MKVSVIMNTVNERRDYLVLAIDSYLRQIKCQVELIISTVEDDPNIDFIKKNYPMCKVVTMPRKDHPIGQGTKSPRGSFLQLNNGIKHITGDWFTFASGNDIAFQNKLSLEVETCLRHNKQVCYSAYNYIDEAGEYISYQGFHDYDFDKHLKGNFVADCSMVSRRLVNKYMPFRVELNNYAYWDLWLRIRKIEGNVFVYNSAPTWGYRQDRDSMHVKRFADPIKMAEAERDKNIMLKLHQ